MQEVDRRIEALKILEKVWFFFNDDILTWWFGYLFNQLICGGF